MRVGLNPNKDVKTGATSLHQVVIPVYIPSMEGYFKDSFRILQHCLNSLFKTVHPSTFITIVNNGSCSEVRFYLEGLYKEGRIKEIVHSENIGKMNSIIKGLAGHNSPLVTISDSDVLFLSGWQKATYFIFNSFPKAGVVGLTPQFKSYENFCGNLLFDNLFSKDLKFDTVENPEALERFYESIGWDKSFNHDYLKKHLCISKGACKAVVGSGHFVATYRREIFNSVNTFFDAKLGRDSEHQLDILPLKKDLWRLTTANNYAYHMGNSEESWMEDEIKKIVSKKEILNLKLRSYSEVNRIKFFIKNRFFAKFLSFSILKKVFYSIKGLPTEFRGNY